MSETYRYFIDGEQFVGTIEDVAHALQSAHYAGLDMNRTVYRYAPLERLTIRTESSGYDADDYATVTVKIGEEVAHYRIDGRA